MPNYGFNEAGDLILQDKVQGNPGFPRFKNETLEAYYARLKKTREPSTPPQVNDISDERDVRKSLSSYAELTDPENLYKKMPPGVTDLNEDAAHPQRFISIDQIPQGRQIAKMVLRHMTKTPEKYYDQIPKQFGIFGTSGSPMNVQGETNIKTGDIVLAADVAQRLAHRDLRSQKQINPAKNKEDLALNLNIDADTYTAQNTLAHELVHRFGAKVDRTYGYDDEGHYKIDSMLPNTTTKPYRSSHGPGEETGFIGHIISSLFNKTAP